MSSTTLLMTTNYLDLDVVSNATVSSEQTAFPVLNIYNTQRRSKVYRSNGYWEITASNKTLVFQETVAVDLTATLTEGSYTSTAALLAEIKAQMESIGASTYTWETDGSTNKIKVTSNGGGGGGILTIKWTASTGLASILGFDSVSDDSGLLIYTADELRISTEEWIKWDFGISTLPTAFIMVGKRNVPMQVTPSSVIKLQASETDVWTSPSYEATLTYDDRAIVLINSAGLHTEALRYWRIQVVDVSNPTGYIEIGSMFLGRFFDPVRGRTQFPFAGTFVDRSTTVFSEGGQTFSDVREKTEEFNIDWFGLTVSEKEELDLFWDDYGTAIPFFVVFDSTEAFSSTKNYYTRYVKFDRPPSYNLVSPGVYQMAMTLREEL